MGGRPIGDRGSRSLAGRHRVAVLGPCPRPRRQGRRSGAGELRWARNADFNVEDIGVVIRYVAPPPVSAGQWRRCRRTRRCSPCGPRRCTSTDPAIRTPRSRPWRRLRSVWRAPSAQRSAPSAPRSASRPPPSAGSARAMQARKRQPSSSAACKHTHTSTRYRRIQAHAFSASCHELVPRATARRAHCRRSRWPPRPEPSRVACDCASSCEIRSRACLGQSGGVWYRPRMIAW